MPRRIWASLALAVLVLTPAAMLRADDPPKVQDKDLEGEWELVSVVIDGKDASLSGDAKPALSVKGNVMTVRIGGKDHRATFKVDATKTPRTIDVSADDDGKQGASIGIYEVKDDELRVCRVGPDKDRPKEFSSKAGTGVVLVTWKRAKGG